MKSKFETLIEDNSHFLVACFITGGILCVLNDKSILQIFGGLCLIIAISLIVNFDKGVKNEN